MHTDKSFIGKNYSEVKIIRIILIKYIHTDKSFIGKDHNKVKIYIKDNIIRFAKNVYVKSCRNCMNSSVL